MPDTSGSVVLGAPGSQTATETPAFEDLSEEELEALANMGVATGTEPGEPEKVTVDTAFLVIWDVDGSVTVTDYQGDALRLERPPTPDLILGAAAVLVKDLTAQETAQHTIQLQMAQARAMQEQMHAQQIQQRLNLPGGK